MRKLKRKNKTETKYEQIAKSYKKGRHYLNRGKLFQKSELGVHKKEPRNFYYFAIGFFFSFGLFPLVVSIYLIISRSEVYSNNFNKILGLLCLSIYSLTIGIVLIFILLYYYFTRYKKIRKISIESLGISITIINSIIYIIIAILILL